MFLLNRSDSDALHRNCLNQRRHVLCKTAHNGHEKPLVFARHSANGVREAGNIKCPDVATFEFTIHARKLKQWLLYLSLAIHRNGSGSPWRLCEKGYCRLKKMRRISSDWCAERLQLDASNYSSRYSFLAPLCRPAGGRTFLNKDSLMIANESGCFAEMLDSLILKILKSGPSVGNISWSLQRPIART